jgi:phosphohistidine phosphatase
MKHLWILRHGKAVEANPSVADPQRPLAALGKAQSRAMGEFLKQRKIKLDRIHSSSSLRTRETAESFLEGGGLKIPLELTERIYNAGGTDLLEYVRGLKKGEDAVMLVGHMPGVGELVSLLVTDQDDLAIKFKPGSLVLVNLDVGSWEAVEAGSGELALLLPPPKDE